MARVLDMACNDAAFAANLALVGHEVHGIDLNPECIERAHLRAGRSDCSLMGAFFCADALNEPSNFEAASFDAVVGFEVVEHVADPDALLLAMRRMVKRDGRLYVSTPNAVDHGGDLPNWDHVEPKGHVRVFVPKTFQELLSRHGTVERMEQGPDGVMVAEVSL